MDTTASELKELTSIVHDLVKEVKEMKRSKRRATSSPPREKKKLFLELTESPTRTVSSALAVPLPAVVTNPIMSNAPKQSVTNFGCQKHYLVGDTLVVRFIPSVHLNPF